jgi:hypothetical protein
MSFEDYLFEMIALAFGEICIAWEFEGIITAPVRIAP